MENISRSNIKLSHVGIVVKDMEKTVKYLESLGIGPFKPYDFESLPPLIKPISFRGKPYEGKTKLLVGNIGDLTLELFEPIEGESTHKEFLDEKGEGIHHLGFAVDDLDGEIDRYTDKGASTLLRAEQVNGGGAAYLEVGVADLIFELEKLF